MTDFVQFGGDALTVLAWGLFLLVLIYSAYGMTKWKRKRRGYVIANLGDEAVVITVGENSAPVRLRPGYCVRSSEIK